MRRAAALIAVVAAAATGAVAAPSAFAAEQLPDLVADPPERVDLSVDATAKGVPSLLVRFDGFVHNAGPGALEMRGDRPSTSDPMAVSQRFFDAGGPLFEDRPSPPR